jgi:hypothetical protein
LLHFAALCYRANPATGANIFRKGIGTSDWFCGCAAYRAESLRLSARYIEGRGFATGGVGAKRVAGLPESQRLSALEAAQPH